MDHRIEKFMAVVELESFTDAAERLHVSQPSLSVAIKNLESELGAQLIIRGGNFFQVTDEGKLVYQYGATARLQLKNLKAELATEVKSQSTLKVGLIDSVAHELFSTNQIDVSGQLEVRIDNSSRLLRAIRLDQLDMAILTKPFGSIASSHKIINESVEEFSLVCAPSNAKVVLKRLKSDREIDDFLTYDQSSTSYQWINRAMNQQGVSYDPKFFSTSPELLVQMAESGRGTALLPKSMVASRLKDNKLVEIKGFSFYRPLIVVVLKDKFISEEMKKIVKLL